MACCATAVFLTKASMTASAVYLRFLICSTSQVASFELSVISSSVESKIPLWLANGRTSDPLGY